MGKDIFIAFTGPKIEQTDAILEFSPGYECWNLATSRLQEFLQSVQKRIPPMNENVLKNYRREDGTADSPFGIGFEDYAKCSWGLLLPDLVQDSLGNSYAEIMFLLNLYSPRFLNPVFYLSDFGIYRPDHGEHHLLYYHDQNQANRFKRREFVEFYEELISESGYGAWQADRMARWGSEDMRLFVACLLYKGLRKNEHSKDVFTWQRESADMATILEALFTAGTGDNTEVSYKLRKRVAAMLSVKFPNIEKEVKDLYKQRSAFVHGAFFMQFRKELEIKDGNARLPTPPFNVLYQQKERIRFALVAYVHLNKVRKMATTDFKGYGSVLDILERAVIDLEMRSAVKVHTERLLDLM
jgi:hypothetical protein